MKEKNNIDTNEIKQNDINANEVEMTPIEASPINSEEGNVNDDVANVNDDGETAKDDENSVNDDETTTKKPRQKNLVFRSDKEADAYRIATEKGDIMFPEGKKVNCHCVAKFISLVYENLIFEPEEKAFYEKNTSKGLWEIISEDDLNKKILKWLNSFCVEVLDHGGFGALLRKGIGREILSLLEEYVSKEDFFKRKEDEYIIHTQNCFLKYDFQAKQFIELPLTDESIVSRHQISVSYEPEKENPMFMEHLLKPMLTSDEIEVLLQYFGMCLIGDNLSQKVLMINGCAGGGKSTCVNVIEKMIGQENVAEFRVQRINSGFETKRYTGKSLLCGKDVPANFLKNSGAFMLKALTGKDYLETESKHSNAKGHIIGNFNVILVSNCNQPVPVNGDRDAWARRLLVVKFKGAMPKNPITDFDEYLLEKEGSGILNAVLIRLKTVLDNEGIIAVSETQRQAIESLLNESEGIKCFVQNCIEPVEIRDIADKQYPHDISTMEAYLAYKGYCQQQSWLPENLNTFEKEFPNYMAEVHSRMRCNDIHREPNSIVRGYHGVRFTSDGKEM